MSSKVCVYQQVHGAYSWKIAGRDTPQHCSVLSRGRVQIILAHRKGAAKPVSSGVHALLSLASQAGELAATRLLKRFSPSPGIAGLRLGV